MTMRRRDTTELTRRTRCVGRGLLAGAAALLLTIHSTSPAAAGTCYHPEGNLAVELWGDVTLNTAINVADATCVLLVALAEASNEAPPQCLTAPAAHADLNCDGARTVSDVQLAIWLALGGALGSFVPVDTNGCPAACAPCVPPGQGSCFIGQTCIPDGGLKAAMICETCQSALNPSAWSPAPDDTECEEAHVCSAGECVPGGSPCAGQPNGTPCSDDNACTLGDTCQNGECAPGAPVNCGPASSSCTNAPQCNPSSGECEETAKDNGTACVDVNTCPGSCQSGICAGFDAVSAQGDVQLCETSTTLVATPPGSGTGQ